MDIKDVVFLFTLAVSMPVLCSGCAATLRKESVATLPHSYSQFDMKLDWEHTVSDRGVTVRGVIRNLRWLYAEGLEVWVALVGPDGTVAARDAALIVPNPLRIQEQAGFTVLLPARPQPGSRLSFTYRYNAVEDVEGSASWMQSFDADL